ncbi:MAG: PilN domain-containing protein [Capsulimonas sp.]|uniref:PilN domain-containing protein n=1 Tax=Capsulimonas sp. TaxID=2494211 RepID=UPI003267D013
MPSINMVALRRAEKRRQENNIRKIVYAILGEIGVFVLLLTFMSARMFGINGQIGDLDNKLQKLQPKVTAIQALQQETSKLMPKVTTLASAKGDTLFWYDSIYAVTRSLPSRTWLTSIGTQGNTPSAAAAPATANAAPAGDAPTLSVSGVALNQGAVGEAMLHMNHEPSLESVDLAYVQSQKTGTTDTVAFQMTVHLKQPAAPAAKGVSDAQKS